MMYDTTTFGGFSHALLRSFRDEYRKATVMVFSVLSDIVPSNAEMGYVCLIIIRSFISSKRGSCRYRIQGKSSTMLYVFKASMNFVILRSLSWLHLTGDSLL